MKLKAVLALFILFLLLIISSLYYTLYKIDASIGPLNSEAILDANNSNYVKRKHIVLISYAGGHSVFFKNQNALAISAVNKGFDSIISYRRSHIDEDFYVKNKAILTAPTGAGYWLWKPYFILKTMEEYEDDTIIIYADSGVVFQRDIKDLIGLLKNKPMVLPGHGKPTPYRQHLKMEARNLLNIPSDSPELNEQNIWAYLVVLKNNKETRDIVKKWLDICQIPGAISNEPFDQSIQDKGFEYHQHDQSLLSVIAARHKDQITIIPRNVMTKEYGVVNFHRHPEGQYTSALVVASGLNRKFADIIFNNFLMRKIRELLAEPEINMEGWDKASD